MKCAYCGREWRERNEACASCGAPNTAKITEIGPCFYDGYIYYAIRRWDYDSFEFIFYKGITFVGRVLLNRMEMEKIPPYEDYMPYVMEKLKEQIHEM